MFLSGVYWLRREINKFTDLTSKSVRSSGMRISAINWRDSQISTEYGGSWIMGKASLWQAVEGLERSQNERGRIQHASNPYTLRALNHPALGALVFPLSLPFGWEKARRGRSRKESNRNNVYRVYLQVNLKVTYGDCVGKTCANIFKQWYAPKFLSLNFFGWLDLL